MSSSFAFGFSGDDIDVDPNEKDEPICSNSDGSGLINEALPLQEPRKLDLDDMLSSLPSQISYNTIELPDSLERGYPVCIPRRDVSDIRAQLMAEDDPEKNENEKFIRDLETGDITPTVYEGGFKTWECSVDLAAVASESYQDFSNLGVEGIEVIELGAGTAIPSLSLLRILFESKSTTQDKKFSFVLADYNESVLKLVTLPNILLTWYICCKNPAAGTESEFEIDSALLDEFRNYLSARRISLSFISGCWSPRFVDIVAPASDSTSNKNSSHTVILASETIYSPASIRPFAETITALMRRKNGSKIHAPKSSLTGVEEKSESEHGPPQDIPKSRTLLAAKRVYFGVGGSVDDFIRVLRGFNGENLQVKLRLQCDHRDDGVGRDVLEITV